MKKWKLTTLFAIGLIALLITLSGLCQVQPGEVVVVRRLGRLIEPVCGPGLHWRLPLGIDHIDRVRSDVVRQVTISQAGSDGEPSAGEAMTGDLNLLRFRVTVQYRVAVPGDYVLRIENVEPTLAIAAESSVSRALAIRGVDAVLRSERQAIAQEIERDLQSLVDRLQCGVSILGVSLTDARPPAEVAADFTAAQAAESERDRRVNEATSYRETTATASLANARAKLEAAHAAARRTLLLAHAEATRFEVLLHEAAASRSLTVRRLYIESMQVLLAGVKRKLILPPGGELDVTLLGVNPEQAGRGATSAERDGRPGHQPSASQ
jgi:membrane protease subunit HflK